MAIIKLTGGSRKLAAAPPNHPVRFPASRASLSPFGCRRPDRFHNVGREAGERQKPTDVSVRDALLFSEVRDRLGLTVIDPAPAPAEIERTGQVSWPRRLAPRQT
jgi:hypothetical protein